MFLSMIGFVLAMLGIMCYVWARLPLSSRIVSSAVGGFSIALGLAALLAPMSFAPVNRAMQSPALASVGLPTIAIQQEKLPGPR